MSEEIIDRCKCTLRESMLGDGCRVCQPRTYIAYLEDALKLADGEIAQLEAELADARKDQARYQWIRNESWAMYNYNKGKPHLVTFDSLQRPTHLAENAAPENAALQKENERLDFKFKHYWGRITKVLQRHRERDAAQAKRIQDLEGEDKISAAVIDRCVNLLAQIAITLKGEPKELTRHSYHDLPELVSILHLENELHKAKIDDLEQDLQFVERWANHHGTKQNVTAQEALSCIQHYPSITAITKSYKDGVIPNTRNPYAEIESLRKRVEELSQPIPDWKIELLFNRAMDYRELRISEAAYDKAVREILSASKNGE